VSARQAYLLAAASGILLAFAFPPLGLFPLVFAALVPLLIAVEKSDPRRGRRGAGLARARRHLLLGFVSGFVFFLGLLYWIPFLPPNNLTIPWLMGPSLVLMAAYLSVFPALFTLLLGWVRHGSRVSLLVAAPALWASLEFLRSLGPLGFPWGTLGYALAPMVTTLQFASVTGIWGVSAWVILVNALLLATFQRTEAKRRALDASLVILALAIPYFHAKGVMREPGVDESVRVALVQVNVDSEIKWDPAHRARILDKLFRLSREAAAREKPDLVVWPESATPFMLLREPEHFEKVKAFVDSLDVPLLTGTVDERIERRVVRSYNSAALLLPGSSPVEVYDKVHLVPFSERMPFQEVLPFLSAFNWGQSDFTPGRRIEPMDLRGRGFGPLVCFEAIFPSLPRSMASRGARFLVNITNDEWFGNTAAPFQHAQMAVFRAVENRIPMARCANTGISMIVDAYGRVLGRTSTFTDAVLTGDLRLSAGRTFYSRHGDVAAWALLLVSLASVATAAFLKPL
jgi:apolipoprotein N-acyltransferase